MTGRCDAEGRSNSLICRDYHCVFSLQHFGVLVVHETPKRRIQ